MEPVTHEVAEARSMAMHRAVARRLHDEQRALDAARVRVRRWLETGEVDRRWAEAWDDVLAGGLDEVAAFLVEDSATARDLRQASPFAGVLAPRARWEVLGRAEAGRVGA